MKQMIKNHEAIESLEDFIYYDKSTGKIVVKKPMTINNKATIFAIPDFYDDIANISSDMKQGDIIVDSANSVAVIITENTNDWFMATGTESGNPIQIVLHKGEAEEFTIIHLELGTKLYLHDISFEGSYKDGSPVETHTASFNFKFVSNSSEKLTSSSSNLYYLGQFIMCKGGYKNNAFFKLISGNIPIGSGSTTNDLNVLDYGGARIQKCINIFAPYPGANLQFDIFAPATVNLTTGQISTTSAISNATIIQEFTETITEL